MNVDLKDRELGLISETILNDIRTRLAELATLEVYYHTDLEVVSRKLEMVQTDIELENKIDKFRNTKTNSNN